MDDLIGLSLNAQCGAIRERDQKPCLRPPGHPGPHNADPPQAQGENQESPSCPDCGGEMILVPFRLDADDEETIRRVVLSWDILKQFPVDLLDAVHEGKATLTIQS